MPTEPPIVILGAGGHGRGILEILRAAAIAQGQECRVAGFLDEQSGLSGTKCGGLPVLGGLEELPRLVREGHCFLLGIGDPLSRRGLACKLEGASVQFMRAVHPTATLYGDVTVGPGAVIAAGVVVAANTKLGTHVLLNLNATVGHDCVLEAFATVGPGANLGGRVWMGEAAFVGLNGTVLPGKRIGSGARLGAGSTLLQDLAADRVAFGIPARVIEPARTRGERGEI